MNRMRAGWLVVLCVLSDAALATDWPTDRHDVARSCVTAERVRGPLSLRWVYRGPRPTPAWPTSQWNEAKAVFDRAPHLAAARGLVFFGSSADGKLYALDAAAGDVRWTLFTGGPIRVAPTVWNGRVYVSSDDGCVYCADADTGRILWRFRAAPHDTCVIGNEALVSLWPARAGVLVDDGVAYFAAGLFPSEGVYVYAVDAATGRLIWRNDSAGAMYIQNPHPGCDGFSGVSPQGAMAASKRWLFIPAGRAVPAVFDRRDGRLVTWKYGSAWKGVVRDGGATISLVDGAVFTSPGDAASPAYAAAFEPVSWRKVIRSTDKQILAGRTMYFLLSRTRVRAVARREFKKQMEAAAALDALQSWYKKRTPEEDARLKELLKQEQAWRRGAAGSRWVFRGENLQHMILAGDTLFVGSRGAVTAVDARTGAKTWEAKIDGTVYDLAAADGRLFASTDTGAIYCFGQGAGAAREISPRVVDDPYTARGRLKPLYRAAADAIARLSGVRRGWAVVLCVGDGRLAWRLARRTEWKVICVVRDERRARAARALFDSTGLYGRRAFVRVARGPRIPAPAFCANVVVSDEPMLSGRVPKLADELLRVLRPYGGVLLLGQPRNAPRTLDPDELRAAAPRSKELRAELIRRDGLWLKVTRGPLPGAADWTHQYAAVAATACSEDQAARGPFELLWFGPPGPKKSVKGTLSPLCAAGRLFVPASPAQAYDAFNGTPLWEAPIADVGAAAATEDSLYLARKTAAECVRLDARTGERLAMFRVPRAAAHRDSWGYLAVDRGLLFGTGLSVFELDEPDWALAPEFERLRIVKQYVRQAPGDASLHGSRHWLIRRMNALMKEVDERFAGRIPPARLAKYKARMLRIMARASSRFLFALDRRTGALRWSYVPRPGAYICHASIAIGDGRVFLVEGGETDGEATTKHLVALDEATGAKLWETRRDLTAYCRPGPLLHRPPRRVLVNSTECLSLAYARGVLVLGEVWGGRNLFALSARDGRLLWSHPVRYNYYYRRRSMVVGGRVYTDRFAYDLRTGAVVLRENPVTGEREPWEYLRSYGCGGSTASAHCLFFRSSVLSYYDLEDDQGITNFSGVRPGCWINAIPAAGLLLAPDQTRGCTCPFPIKASVALRPVKRYRAWSYIRLSGPWKPVKHLALNLGAPGDRRGDDGTLWLGYPRPFHPRGLRFQLPCEFGPGGRFFRGAPDGDGVAGRLPWVCDSGALGLRKLVVPVDDPGAAPARYAVRLFFAETFSARPGERVFDVRVQGRVRLENVDVARLAGGPRKSVVKEIRPVTAAESIVIEFAPRTRAAALLNGVEVVRLSSAPVAAPRALSAPLVGRWTWAAPRPLENRAKPGAYDAAPRGPAAQAGDGQARVHDGGALGKPAGVKDDSFFVLGQIAELQAASAFAWTFERVVFHRGGNHILAGSIQNGFGPGSLFIVMARAAAAPGGRVTVTLWGPTRDGKPLLRAAATITGLELRPGRPHDIQVFYESGRVAARVRASGAKSWGRLRWRSVPVVRLNPRYLSLPGAQSVYLGKYAAASTLASDFSVGEVRLRAAR